MLLRQIAARYPQYNVTTFMPLWLFTDQYALVLPNTLQNIGIALCCMLLIALLLIPQPLTALWVSWEKARLSLTMDLVRIRVGVFTSLPLAPPRPLGQRRACRRRPCHRG